VPGRRAGIVLVVAAAIAGCGSGGNAPKPGLTTGQSQALMAQLQAARSSASAHDVAGAKTALGRFTASVTKLRRSGALSDASAHTMRVAAARILKRIQTDNAAPAQPAPTTTSTPTPAPAPAPTPAPKPKEHAKHPAKEKGPGKGKGHGKEGGD
jgi:hypothetical protein